MDPVANRKSFDLFYTIEDKKEANVGCGTKFTQVNLEGSGIIELPDGYTIIEESVANQVHQVFPRNLNISFAPIGNLTKIVVPSHLIK